MFFAETYLSTTLLSSAENPDSQSVTTGKCRPVKSRLFYHVTITHNYIDACVFLAVATWKKLLPEGKGYKTLITVNTNT